MSDVYFIPKTRTRTHSIFRNIHTMVRAFSKNRVSDLKIEYGRGGGSAHGRRCDPSVPPDARGHRLNTDGRGIPTQFDSIRVASRCVATQRRNARHPDDNRGAWVAECIEIGGPPIGSDFIVVETRW